MTRESATKDFPCERSRMEVSGFYASLTHRGKFSTILNSTRSWKPNQMETPRKFLLTQPLQCGSHHGSKYVSIIASYHLIIQTNTVFAQNTARVSTSLSQEINLIYLNWTLSPPFFTSVKVTKTNFLSIRQRKVSISLGKLFLEKTKVAALEVFRDNSRYYIEALVTRELPRFMSDPSDVSFLTIFVFGRI